MNAEAFGKEIAALVRGEVERAAAPLIAENVALRAELEELRNGVAAQVAAAVAAIPVPKDGASVTAEQLAPTIGAEIARQVAALPPPAAGKDADPEAVRALVIDEVAAAVAALPPPRDGADAKPEDVAAEVARAVAALPPAKDGASVTVEQVMPGLLDAVRSAIAAIPPPADGKTVALEDVQGWLEQRMNGWALDFERRAQGVLERAAERIPKPKDGRDGLDLRNLSVEQEADGRTVRLTLKDDERTQHVHLTFPVVIDRGVFREGGPRDGALYERGDGVTFGGSFWIAQKDGPDGKPGLSPDWRLAVKKGRDGKDAVVRTIDPDKPVKLS